MQFLVYLTVLMVSISTVLLEVHWLTTPAPQPKPAVQTAAALAPVPKVEGPNAALSPVYPTKPGAVESTANAQQTATSSAAPATKTDPPQKPQSETTGVATRDEGVQQTQPVAVQPAAAVSNNRCDIEACASTYKSFRAADCTYQPYGGERRLCIKPPVTARSAAREADETVAIRRSTRQVELRDRDDERRFRQPGDEDDDVADVDDSQRDRPSFFLFGRSRW